MSHSAKDMLNAANEDAHRVGDDANDAAHRLARDVKDRSRRFANSISAEAQHIRERLAEGTEGLSEAARERVIAARHRALEARRQAGRAFHDGRDAASDLFERQPLVIGALAFAVGAAVAAMLPKTRTEDSYLGARRDALMDEAERVFYEEKARAQSALNAARSELETAAKDATDAAGTKLGDVASEVEAKAKKTAERVADKASKAAK